MIYKYIYRSRVNGVRIRTDKKLDPKKYELISEYRDAQIKVDKMILK